MNRWLLCLHLCSVAVFLASWLTLKSLTLVRAGAGATDLEDDFAGFVREMVASPAVMVAIATGFTMLAMTPVLLQQPWLYLKLILVSGLLALCRGELAPAEETRPIATPRAAHASLVGLLVLLFGIAAAVIARPFAH